MNGEQHRNLRLRHADGDVRHGGDLGIGGLFRSCTAVGVGTRCLALVAGMNKEDIIRFGEQADEAADRKIAMRGEFHPDWHAVRDEAFAALVAAAEREACARVCEEVADDLYMDSDAFEEVFRCANKIRARGEK